MVAGDNPLDLNIKKLLAKRIDVFIDDENATQNFLKSSGSAAQKIKEAGCASSASLFIAFSPKNPKSKIFAKLIQEKIVEMRRDGTLKKILMKYGVQDWKQ